MIKLIDFGCAAWEGGPPGSVVQTCYYRAPEVTLGLSWTYPCDMWSVGCIILELFEMRRTFDTLSTAQHLALMERVCGEMPKHMLSQAACLPTAQHLIDKRKCRILWPECSGGSKSARRSASREEAVLLTMPLATRLAQPSLFPLSLFLQGLFRLDPMERSTPTSALSSDWLQSNCPTPVPSYRSLRSACATPVAFPNFPSDVVVPPHMPAASDFNFDVPAHAPLLWPADALQAPDLRRRAGCGDAGRPGQTWPLLGCQSRQQAGAGPGVSDALPSLIARCCSAGALRQTLQESKERVVDAESWNRSCGVERAGGAPTGLMMPTAPMSAMVPPTQPMRCMQGMPGPLLVPNALAPALSAPLLPSGVMAGPWGTRLGSL